MTYYDLVKYIKNHHVNWNTDLFDVLRGFFEEYSRPLPPFSSPSHSDTHMPQKTVMSQRGRFEEPEGGEYTTEDLLNLFSA